MGRGGEPKTKNKVKKVKQQQGNKCQSDETTDIKAKTLMQGQSGEIKAPKHLIEINAYLWN